MNVTDLLAQTGGLQQIARELGISEQEANRGAEALAPTILGGFKKQGQAQPGGLAGLGGLLGQLGGGGLLADVLSPQPTGTTMPNASPTLRLSGLGRTQLAALRAQAKAAGMTAAAYATRLLEEGIALEQEARGSTFDALLAPVRRRFRATL